MTSKLPTPSGSTAYRNTRVEDDDDDDLDDLDDVLPSFAAKPSQPQPAPPPIATSKPQPSPQGLTTQGDDDDFEASLVEGMESLLKSLAGNHPPGPMIDVPQDSTRQVNGGVAGGEKGSLSKEEEEKAWQKAIETLLSGEGIEALGLDQSTPPPLPRGGPSSVPNLSPLPQLQPQTNPKPTQTQQQQTFEETIKKTLESLQNPSLRNGVSSGAGGGGGDDDIAALLRQLGADPSMLGDLAGLDGGGGDGDGEEGDELGGLLDGMMKQLMTREVLEEPMTELASKYPAYLSSPPPNLPSGELEKYKSQSLIITKIVETFQKPDYTDENDGAEVARLVGVMQDLGGPPGEIMGDLPEGFDLGALGAGDEGCTIM